MERSCVHATGLEAPCGLIADLCYVPWIGGLSLRVGWAPVVVPAPTAARGTHVCCQVGVTASPREAAGRPFVRNEHGTWVGHLDGIELN